MSNETRVLSPEESEVYKEITDTIMMEDVSNLRKASLVMSITDKYARRLAKKHGERQYDLGFADGEDYGKHKARQGKEKA